MQFDEGRRRPVSGFGAFAWLVQIGLKTRRDARDGKYRNLMQMTHQKPTTNFVAKDGRVQIMTTTTPKRWPPHQYPVVVVRLFPCPGTRVLSRSDGSYEWMPRWSELLALISQMGLSVAVSPSDKSEERRLRFEKINAHRREKVRS